MGYHQAGFEVVGVDSKYQPNYPFPQIQSDALEYLSEHHDFDLIHASPPCQAYSLSVKSDGRWSHGTHKGFNEPRLIEPLRKLLIESRKSYVIENVKGALPYLIDPIMLCGPMFNLSIQRHRYFEANFRITAPPHTKCWGLTHPVAEEWRNRLGIKDRRIYSVVGKGRQSGSYDVWRALMQIPWAMHDYEMAEAIPPPYTKYIGEQWLKLSGFL